MALVAAASLVPMFWTWQADDYAKLDTRGVVCVTPLRQYFPNSTESLRTRKLAMPPRTASCLTARRNYPPAAHQRYVSGSGTGTHKYASGLSVHVAIAITRASNQQTFTYA